MTITELDQLTHDTLMIIERNERRVRHIEAARRYMILMAVALILLAVALSF